MADQEATNPLPVPMAWWQDLVVDISQPWPEPAALIDLLYNEVRPGGPLGRRALAKKWGWPERRARHLIAKNRPASRLRPANAVQLPVITKPPVPLPSRKVAQSAPTTDPAARAVYEAWAALKEQAGASRKRLKFTTNRQRVVRVALKDFTADELILVLRFAFEYPYEDQLTTYWRKHKYLDLVNLLNREKVDRNITRAHELWSGSQWLPQTAAAEDTDNDGASWRYMLELVADHPSPPEHLHPDPQSDYALKTALADVGGWVRVGSTRPGYELNKMGQRFCNIAAAAYHAYDAPKQPLLIKLDGEKR